MKEESTSTYTELINQLPRPLAFRWRKLLREEIRWEQGNGSSNFAFVVASVCGLSVRFLATLVISEYLQSREEKAAPLLMIIQQRLSQPSDGGWLQLLDEVIKVQSSNSNATLAHRVSDCLYRKRDVSWQKKPTTVRVLMQKMVEYRNHLLHGTKNLTSSTTQLAVRQTRTIVESLESLVSQGTLLGFNGEVVFFLRGVDEPLEKEVYPKSELKEFAVHAGWEESLYSQEIDSQLWKCFWYEGENRSLVFLGPLLWFVTTKDRQQWMDYFFNGYHSQSVEYVSFTLPLVKTAQLLGVSSSRVLHFLGPSSELSNPIATSLDLDDFTEQYNRIFVGRKRVLSAMLKFCTSDTGRLGLVTSAVGLGKTALFAKLYQKWKQDQRWPKKVVPFWVFFSSEDEATQPVRFFQTMLEQMDVGSGQAPKDYTSNLTLLKQELGIRWEEFLASQPGKNVVLFLDGGVAKEEKEPSVWDFLPRPVKRRGRRFSILASLHPESLVLRQQLLQRWDLEPEKCVEIEGASPLPGLSLEDIASTFPRQKRTKQGQHALHKLSRMAQLTGDSIHADPGLVRVVLSTLDSGQMDWQQVENLPRNLHEAYEVVWRRWPRHHQFLLHRMMGILALLKGYVSDTMVSRLLQLPAGLSFPEVQVSPSAIPELRSVVNAHLLFRQKRFRVWHDSMKTFLIHQFHPRDAVEVLYKPLLQFCSEKPLSIDQQQYQLRWSVTHFSEFLQLPMLKGEELDKAQESLWSLVWDEEHWAHVFEEDIPLEHLWGDWSRLSQAFRPKASHPNGHTWRNVGRSFHVAKRAHFVMSQKELLTQQSIKLQAQNKNWEGLLECIETGPTPYHKEWLAHIADQYVPGPSRKAWKDYLKRRQLIDD